MAAESIQDRLQGLLGHAEQNGSRWLLLAVGVIILLRLRLILFATALPIMAYWYYSNQAQASGNEDGPENDAYDDGDEDNAEPASMQDDEKSSLPKSRGFGDGSSGRRKESDIYDDSFWSGEKPESQKRNGPASGSKSGISSFDDGPKEGFSWDGGRDELDDFLTNDSKMDLGLDGLQGRSNLDLGLDSGAGDFDRGMDMDFGFGGMDDMMGGKGKGKGKGKSKDGKGKDPNAPREADPKQVFVANIGEIAEEDLRSFFEAAGEVDRLKVLRNPDGTSKGVCFVTFRTEEQALKAVSLHTTPLDGTKLTIRLAHGGNKGKDKGEGKGADRDGAVDLGGSERFGGAFGGDRDRSSSGSKGKGKGKGRSNSGEVEEALEEALAQQDGPLRVTDFDYTAKRFLTELRNQDKADDGSRFREAMDMVLRYTVSKERGAVRKWPAYVFTLLQKFDPQLSELIRERDQDRRAQKGSGRSIQRARQDSGDMEDRD